MYKTPVAGMVLFLLGVDIGILPMGKALGAELPRLGSLPLIIGIAFLIGFAATIAEPDVIVLTNQVDTVSDGAIAKNVLVYIIAIGVAFFVAMAMIRILLGFRIAYLMAAGYIVIIILAFFTPMEFVPVAFDSGGVTTGPMTVPIILALGLLLSQFEYVLVIALSIITFFSFFTVGQRLFYAWRQTRNMPE